MASGSAAAALTVHAKILIRSSNGSFLEFPLNGAPDDLLLRALDIAQPRLRPARDPRCHRAVPTVGNPGQSA